ncbi:MAG: hypothetical protein ACRDTD_18090 [Pseudonocardiaceae bacterium]
MTLLEVIADSYGIDMRSGLAGLRRGLPLPRRWPRDTKDRTKPAHYRTSTEWHTFIRGMRDGELD